MRIIYAKLKHGKAKVKVLGKTLDTLQLLVAISKAISENIEKEKGVDVAEAQKIIVECITDGMKKIN